MQVKLRISLAKRVCVHVRWLLPSFDENIFVCLQAWLSDGGDEMQAKQASHAKAKALQASETFQDDGS